jgi:hypothetical protein
LLSDESIDAEVEKRVVARLAGAPAPERLPGVSAGNVFKLKGSADGEQAAHILREKEIETRVEAKLKEGRKEERTESRAATLDESFKLATDALGLNCDLRRLVGTQRSAAQEHPDHAGADAQGQVAK